jgi:hypothetical protein
MSEEKGVALTRRQRESCWTFFAIEIVEGHDRAFPFPARFAVEEGIRGKDGSQTFISRVNLVVLDLRGFYHSKMYAYRLSQT